MPSSRRNGPPLRTSCRMVQQDDVCAVAGIAHRSFVVLTSTLIMSACFAGTSQSTAPVCRPDSEIEAELPSALNLEHLSGRFRIWLHLASNPDSSVLYGDMFLQSPTPEERSSADWRWRSTADLQLIGNMHWLGTLKVPAELDAGVLYLGCRFCYDGTPTELTVARSSAAGFWGSWKNDFRARDVEWRTGQPAPDPIGTFCAMRL